MNKISLVFVAVVTWLSSCTSSSQNTDVNQVSIIQDSLIEGRWDIQIYEGDQKFPAWLEVNHSGTKRLVGQYVGITGSARPISIIHFSNGEINFSLPPQWEAEDHDLVFKGRLSDGALEGSMVAANGKSYRWTAKKAPLLIRENPPVWGQPISLFNGKDLSGWKALGENQWVVENGILKSPHSGANLVTDQKFNDFKLHLEFRCPPGSNSGVYLRGRYEVQIIDSKGMLPQKDLLGAVYGFLTPSEMAAKSANEWQSFDITLIGRMVTIVVNGKEVICNQAIPGITGGALDSDEGEPGPIYLQGDHGPIEFRNIVLTPAQ